MSLRLIPHAQAITEFCAGFNGDCGETAELALLHVIDPTRFPLDADQLARIVHRDIAAGWASANGSEPINAIANDLATLGVAFTRFNYSQPPLFDWRGMLANWGGVKPIVFEYANAGRLPGDEPGVSYHFNTCLAWDPDAQVGQFADGDNAVERGGGVALVRYTLADLEAAQICAMLVGEYQLGEEATMVPANWRDENSVLTAPNGVPITLGFREFVLNFPGGWPAWNYPLEAASSASPLELSNPTLGAGTHQPFRATLLEWSQERGVIEAWIGAEWVAQRAALATAQATIAQLQAQLAATQPAQGVAGAPSATPSATPQSDATAQ